VIYTLTSDGIKKKYLFTICETKINNNSGDTLKYINMTCSWLDIYKVNNVNFGLVGQFCLGNYPEVRTVLPRQSSMFKIPVIAKVAANLPQKIKIGLSLQKYTGDNQFFSLFDPRELLMKPETSNMIWSNEVVIH
jgi:hypothetical protein